jgi:integrase
LAPATQRTYLQVLPWLLGDYMDRPIDALDADTLMQLVTDMGKRRTVLSRHGLKLKRGNKGGATIAVKALARLCKVHKINDDPTRDLRADKRLPVIGERPGRLGMEESQQLFAWLHWYAAQPDVTPYKLRGARMLMVAIVTGWRISTVAAWQWEEIDFTAMTTQLPKNKSGHKQTLPLWPVLADIFKPLRQKSGPVFSESWPQEFKRTLPLQVSPHDARKAFAAVMLDMSSQAGVHPMAIELLMQHFNNVTVKSYLRTVPLPDQLRILRPTVAKVSEYYAAKLGDKATLKAMEKLAAVRREEASEYERDRWAATAARKRAKAA